VERLRLLVADDEASARLALVRLSESLGHEVVAKACDGREAVEMAELTAPDLLLLDIAMPNMDGLAAAEAILERDQIPVVIVTGHTGQHLIKRAADCGVFSYLVKPVTRERLAAAISTARARFSDMQGLRHEVGGLKDALEARKLVERAKGVLMRDLGVGEQEAYRWLKRSSSQSNRRVSEIARDIVALESRDRR
jgi:response regulator NasT